MTNEELLKKYIQECFYSGNPIDDEDRNAIMESYGFAFFKARYHIDLMAEKIKNDLNEATQNAKIALEKFTQSIKNK